MVKQYTLENIQEMIVWLAISQEKKPFDIIDELIQTNWTPLVDDIKVIYDMLQRREKEQIIRSTRNCEWCYLPYRMDEPPCSQSLCPTCQKVKQQETARVATACQRTKKLGLTSTLTLKQWLAILNHYEWKCAYCLDRPFEALDHFIPVVRGGGTIEANCVPACNVCNSQKFDTHPDALTIFPPEAVNRVRSYLEQFS